MCFLVGELLKQVEKESKNVSVALKTNTITGETIVEALRIALTQKAQGSGAVLDGIPADLNQVEALEAEGLRILKVFQIHVEDEVNILDIILFDN